MTDRFLSEEDLDLRTLSEEELRAWWDLMLRQAQATNDLDRRLYSHGVFRLEPPWDGLTLDQIVDPDPREIERRQSDEAR
jgi:hypothetical protein